MSNMRIPMPKLQLRAPKLNVLRPWLWYGGALIIFGALLWWRLGSLTHGYSPIEQFYTIISRNTGLILHPSKELVFLPINLPFLLVVRVLHFFDPNSLLLTRLAATLFGLATLSIFYWLVRYWYGERTAVFGTVLFGASAWFLHVSRLGTPEVLQFGVVWLVAASVWLRHSKGPWPVLLCLVLAALFLYVPGMVWFIVAGVIWQWKTLDRAFKQHLWAVTLGGFLLLALLAPLVVAAVHEPTFLLRALSGVSVYSWPQPVEVLHRMADIIMQLALRGPQLPEHWLGHLAVLDAFTLGMIFLGAYAHIKHWQLARSKALACVLALGVLVSGLSGISYVTALVPFAYILAAVGMGLLLERWYVVFPRNPLAQAVGVGLLSLAVLASCWYGFRHYFIAWPNAPQTQTSFTVSRLSPSDTIKK